MKPLILLILLLFPFIAKAGEPADSVSAAPAETMEVDSVYPKQFGGWNPEYGYRHLICPPVLPDSLDRARYRKKHFWRAAGETVGFNLGLWAFDRYFLDGHYSHISWKTIRDNFRHGFEWDDDHLNTNMFAHPYSGNLYYNAGRSNGFNFWQSELFAIGGSAMWELFMECEPPSTNDVIATPIGGAAIGEVLYRSSDLILNDRSTGGERFGRELAAFIVDPIRGLTRIFSGDAWKHRTTTGRRFGIPPISIELSLGARMLSLWDNDETARAGAAAEINIEYGDKFAEESRGPYDYFSFLMELQAVETQPLISRVEIVGRLLSRGIVDKEKIKATVGMFQHFDFFDSDTIKARDPHRSPLFPCVVPYKLGAPACVGAGLMAQYVPTPAFVFDGYVHANGLLLAGILTDFYRHYHRNYNWGFGFSLKAGITASLFRNRFIIDIADQFYKVYTWQGYDPSINWSTTPDGDVINIQGDRSHSTFNHLDMTFKYRLWKRLYLSAGLDLYWRTTNYHDMELTLGRTTIYYPIVKSKQLGTHLMLSYIL